MIGFSFGVLYFLLPYPKLDVANLKTKKIGFWGSAAFVIGNMIGSGIFLLPASLAVYGGIGMIGWVCAACGAILMAYLFGAITKYVPESIGGPYAYTQTAFGDFAAFLVAWGYWISIWVTNAAIAVALVGYLGVFLPMLTEVGILAVLTGLGFIWLFTWINSQSIHFVAKLQVITTILKVIPILMLGLLGLLYINWDHFLPFNRSDANLMEAITASSTLCLFAFLGMESAGIIFGRNQISHYYSEKVDNGGYNLYNHCLHH